MDAFGDAFNDRYELPAARETPYLSAFADYLVDDARAREHTSSRNREHADRFRGQGQGW